MDAFQDLIRRLSAAHDREVSQLQRKLERSYQENSELQIKIDMMQGLVSGWTRSLRNYPPETPRGEPIRASQEPPNNSLIFQAQVLSKKDSAADLESTRSGSGTSTVSTIPGWGGAPVARSKSPPPRPRGSFLGWTSDPEKQRPPAVHQRLTSNSPAIHQRCSDPLPAVHQRCSEQLTACLTHANDAIAPDTQADDIEDSSPKASAGERPTKSHWSTEKHGTPAFSARAKSPIPAPNSPRQAAVTKSTTQMSADIAQMIDQFRDHIRQHGAAGIAGIGRKFRICDDDHNGKLNHAEVVKALKELGFDFTQDQADKLIQQFDTDGDGFLEYEEFLMACRPPMNLRRRRMVQKVFERMDIDKNGVLTIDDIKNNFHPHTNTHWNKGKSREDVAAEFLSTFDVGDHDGNVTLEEFTKYYQGVSASIDEDDYFELMMRNAWHISGGKGWCQNSSCTRVLVTHTDASQEVVEIKNDLGLDKKNYQDVEERLSRQGVSDIKKIELFG